MEDMRLWLHAPIRLALKANRARHGFEERLLTDDETKQIPNDLHEELAIWVGRCAKGKDRGKGFDAKYALEVDEPSTDLEVVVRALRQAQQRGVDAQVEAWLNADRGHFLAELDEPALDYVDKSWWLLSVDDDAEATLMEERPSFPQRMVEASGESPRLATYLAEIERQWKASMRRSFDHHVVCERARTGLREYARTIPALKRAAEEGYNIEGSAIGHLVNAVQAYDSDALVLDERDEQFVRSEIRERPAPGTHAFAVSDALQAHVANLPIPDGVGVKVERISRLSLAVRGDAYDEWYVEEPITVVPVKIDPIFGHAKFVLFVADVPDEATSETSNVPF